MSFYVSAVARNYRIAIKATAIGVSGQTARFRSFLENCANTRLFPVDCDIDITYNWSDNTPGSGTSTVTLTSGSSQVTQDPSGYTLTSIDVTNINISNCTYDAAIFCGDPFVTTTTTTTTTTTSTTTTTTTLAASSYSDPIIKYDQYSSSFTLSGGDYIWPNTGSGGSTYNLNPGVNSTITAFGTGTSQYLRIKGGAQQFGPVGDTVWYINPALTGNFISFNNKSFSYAVVFRLPSPTSYNSTLANFGVSLDAIGAGFEMYCGTVGSPVTPILYSRLYNDDAGGPGGSTILSTSSIWYLAVFTFNKNGSDSTSIKFYLNNNKTDYNSGGEYPFTPSTYFDNTVGRTPFNNLSWGVPELDVAAVIFWDDVVLTQAQVQSLFNEYNSRYTLG